MSQSDDEIKAGALAYLHAYAKDNQFFTGGDVLESYRAAGHPDPENGWRNVWAVLVTKGFKKGWYVKAGRVPPKSKQSHTGSLTQWQSKVFTGVQALTGATATDHLEAMRRDVITRKVDIRTALRKAYELGIEQREVDA